MYSELAEKVRQTFLQMKNVSKSIDYVYNIELKKRSMSKISKSAIHTAYYRIYGKYDYDPRSKLSDKEEKAVVFLLQACALKGHPLKNPQLKNVIASTFGVTVNRKWCLNFLKRHKADISLRKAKTLANSRNNPDNGQNVEYFIEKFNVLVKNSLITEKNLLNYDETRVGPTQGHKSATTRYGVTGTSRLDLTSNRKHHMSSMLPFVSANGKVFCNFHCTMANFKKEEDTLATTELRDYPWKRLSNESVSFPEYVFCTQTQGMSTRRQLKLL